MGSERRAQITDRNRRVLEMLGEHRAMVVSQVGRLLEVSDETAAARLRHLRDLKLISYERIFDRQPATVSISRRGLAVIESTLPPTRVDLKGYRHDIGVGWLWLAARAGSLGPAAGIVSEREMRSSDLRTGLKEEPFGIGLPGFDAYGRRARHYPDLLIERASGKRVAIELELSVKSARRLDTIMRAYAGDGRIDAVLYLVPAGSVERAVSEAVTRAGIADLVQVRRIATAGIAGAEARQAGAEARQLGSEARGRSAATRTATLRIPPARTDTERSR
jgi:hypothetical protein